MANDAVLNLQNPINILPVANANPQNVKKAGNAKTADSKTDKNFASVLKEQNSGENANVQNNSMQKVTAQKVDKAMDKTADGGENTDNVADEKTVSTAEDLLNLYAMLNNTANADIQSDNAGAAISEDAENVSVTEVNIQPAETLTADKIITVDTEYNTDANADVLNNADVNVSDVSSSAEEIKPTDLDMPVENVDVKTEQTAEDTSPNQTQTQTQTQSYTPDENVEKFSNFISDMNINAKDIVSVKYTAYSNVANEQGKTNVENLLQKMFADVPQEEVQTADNAETVNVAETDSLVAENVQSNFAVQTVGTAVNKIAAENTDVNTQTENVQQVSEVQTDTVQGMTQTEENTDNNGDNFAGNSSNDGQNNQELFANKNISNNVHSYGVNQTAVFKMYDIDTAKNTSNQLNTILTSALTDKEFMENIQTTKQMVIQLNPENMGKIMVKLQAVGETMSVKIVSTNSEVRDMISSQLSQLTMALKEQGLNVTNVEVSQSALQNNRENPQNQQGQQQGQENHDKNEENRPNNYSSFREQIEDSLEQVAMA